MRWLVFVLVAASPVFAGDGDIKSEIINRWRNDMGEYGAMMVKACVDQDVEAGDALDRY